MLADWCICFVMAFSGQVIITVAALKMLMIRRLVPLWTVTLLCCAVSALCNTLGSPELQAAWSALSLAISLACYIVLSPMKPLYALFVFACIMLATLVAEFAAVMTMLYGFGVNVTTGPLFAYGHPGTFAFLVVFHAVVLAVLLYLCSVLVRRALPQGRQPQPFSVLLFPISQVALLVATMLAVRVLAFQSDRILMLGAVLTLAVLCAYLVFFVVRWRQCEHELAQARASAAREQGDMVLEQARELEEQAGRVVRLRHDFRNQVQVIEILYSRGERAEALAQLQGLLEQTKREAAR